MHRHVYLTTLPESAELGILMKDFDCIAHYRVAVDMASPSISTYGPGQAQRLPISCKCCSYFIRAR